jgi:hypothetical protein
MAVSSTTPVSITDIEQQIAKVTAALELARAEHFAKAEGAFLAAQKAVANAQTKVNELSAKATTAAAQNRLLLARIALEEQEDKLTTTKAVFDTLKLEQEAAQEFSEKVDLLLAGKKLGKKIKFTKKEKAVLKADKKAAKKIAKAEKKVAKDEKEQAKKLAKAEAKTLKQKAEASNKDEVAVEEPPVAQEKPVAVKPVAVKPVAVKPVVAKKAPAKKSAVKKTPPAKEVVNPTTEEKSVEVPVIAEVTAEPVKEESVEALVTAQPETSVVETIASPEASAEPRNIGVESLDSNDDA